MPRRVKGHKYDTSPYSLRLAGIRARKGGQTEQEFLSSTYSKMMKRINRSFGALKKHGYEHTPAYKFLRKYLDENFGSDALPDLDDIGNDWTVVAKVVTAMARYEKYETHTLKGAREVESRRLHALDKMNLWEDMKISKRKMRNFLKFLSSEESKEMMEIYGGSNQIVEWISRGYFEQGTALSKMQKVFAEHIDKYYNTRYNNYDITKAFVELGIAREDEV